MRPFLSVRSLFVAVLVAAPSLAVAGGDDPASLDVTLSLERQANAAAAPQVQLVRLSAVAGSRRTAKVHLGSQVPIENTTFKTDVKRAKPVVSYTYQNVGLQAIVTVDELGDGFTVAGSLEDSHVERAEPTAQVAIGTLDTDFSTWLRVGEVREILRMESPGGGRTVVTLRLDEVR